VDNSDRKISILLSLNLTSINSGGNCRNKLTLAPKLRNEVTRLSNRGSGRYYSFVVGKE
jgi:hypothetical protein